MNTQNDNEFIDVTDETEGEALMAFAKNAAMNFALGKELTEDEWEALHDVACSVLLELDVQAGRVNITDEDDLPF